MWGAKAEHRPTPVSAPNPQEEAGGGEAGQESGSQNILAHLIFDCVSSSTFTSIWQSTVLFTATQIKYSIGSMQSSYEGALLGELDASLSSIWCFPVK